MNLFSQLSDQPAISMRPYQESALAAIEGDMDRGPGRGLLVLPTGTGKTSVFSELIRRRFIAGNGRALVVAHQLELLEQAARRIEHMVPGISVGIESGDSECPKGVDVVVAGIQSIGRRNTERLRWFKPDVIIIDEAHHAAAASYQALLENFGVYKDDGPYLLGVTATPHRMDNRPLHGAHDRAIFERVLYTYTLRAAINDGYLCNVRGFRAAADGLDLKTIRTTAGDYNQGQLQAVMDDDRVIACGIDAWSRVAADRRTVVFCTGIDHAKHVAEAFQSRGVRADSIDGTMNKERRSEIMRRFRNGEIQVLTNMQLVTEGVDVPEIGCVLMLRPTQSWALYTQMIGRGLRPLPGKPDCIVVDIVGNSDSHALGKSPPASLAGVFELPVGLDLAGATITEALELFDELSDGKKAELFRRVIDIEGLRASLTEVDLLQELSIPEELATISHWSWLKVGDGRYFLGCGSTEAEGPCSARMDENSIGVFELTLRSKIRNERFELGDDIRAAFQAAESLASNVWPAVGAVADSRARWRQAEPTTKQRNLLQKLGYSDEDISRMNKGAACAAISRAFSAKGKQS